MYLNKLNNMELTNVRYKVNSRLIFEQKNEIVIEKKILFRE